MFWFELKKMWKKKTIFSWLFSAIILTVVVNYRVSHRGTLSDYPSLSADTNPFLSVMTKMTTQYHRGPFDTSSDRWQRKQGKQVDREGEEREKSWKFLRQKNREFQEMENIFPTFENPYRHYPVNLIEYESKSLEKWNSLKNFIDRYDIELNEDQKIALKWILFEGEYAKKHGVHSTVASQGTFISNAGRRMVSSVRDIWGLPVCICFCLLFLGIFSDERKNGTLTLLHMQPISQGKIVFVKASLLLLMGVLYLLVSVMTMIIIYLCEGLPLDGFLEIYRVFSKGDNMKYITGIHVLFYSAIGFLSVFLLLSSVVIFLSSRGKNYTKNMIFLTLIGGLIILLTKELPIFRKPWNPIYALDYPGLIMGRLKLHTLDTGMTTMKEITAVGMKPYFFFAIFSMVPFLLTLLPQREFVKERKEVQAQESEHTSLWAFEQRKIISEPGFRLILIGGFLMISLFFFFVLLADFPYVRGEIGEGGRIRSFREDLESTRQELEHVKTHPPGGGEGHWTAAHRDKYETYVRSLKEKLQQAEEDFQNFEARLRAFQDRDGSVYYATVLQQAKKMLGGEKGNVYVSGLKTGSYTRNTYDETVAVLRMAKQKNVQPIVETWVFPSEREEFVEKIYKRASDERWIPRSHSAFFGLYRFLRVHRLDIVFLIVMSIVVFGGYLLDKDTGEQLHFLYTEPIGRAKLHWIKIEVAVFLSASLLALVYIFIFFFGGFSEGLGAWNFPIVYYTHSGFYLIDLWKYLLRVFLVAVAECFFLSSLSTFLSIFVKEKNRLLAGLALVVGGGVFLSNYLPQGILRLLSPFHYLHASTVANGAVKIFRNLPQESFWGSVLILVVWGVILGILGVQLVKRRECL